MTKPPRPGVKHEWTPHELLTSFILHLVDELRRDWSLLVRRRCLIPENCTRTVSKYRPSSTFLLLLLLCSSPTTTPEVLRTRWYAPSSRPLARQRQHPRPPGEKRGEARCGTSNVYITLEKLGEIRGGGKVPHVVPSLRRNARHAQTKHGRKSP